MQPLLSIVVLVFNAAEYLHECLDSLLGQRYSNIEIIAVDDLSTDDSLAICRAYEAKHANFRCVAKALNEGGAVSGNLGVSLAQGEYVALVDSDDLVSPDGYALLMEQAVAHEADIVVGRAARLEGREVSTVAFLYEPFVWTHHRVLRSAGEFPDLIHDGFYWNKVFRTAFLREHGLGMEPGLLYADRPFVHGAYFRSRKTVIIPELVYLWRARPAGATASITQSKMDGKNFLDRLRSMTLEWVAFEGVASAEEYRRAIAVTNLQRALHVMPAMVASPLFRQVFVEGMQRLLKLYGNLDYRALGVRRTLYLRLLEKGDSAAVCYLLALPVDGQVREIGGECYWNQPFLDNPEVGIDNSVSRIDFPTIGFFHICTLAVHDGYLHLELALHDSVVRKCPVSFELQSLHGNGVIAFEPLGSSAAHRHIYRLALDQLAHRMAAGDLYGLILNYVTNGTPGRYRVGRALLTPEVLKLLPLQPFAGCQLSLSAESGGIGVRLDGTHVSRPASREACVRE